MLNASEKIKLMINLNQSKTKTFLFFNNECFYGKEPFCTESVARFDIEIEMLELALKLEKGALNHLRTDNYVEENYERKAKPDVKAE